MRYMLSHVPAAALLPSALNYHGIYYVWLARLLTHVIWVRLWMVKSW